MFQDPDEEEDVHADPEQDELDSILEEIADEYTKDRNANGYDGRRRGEVSHTQDEDDDDMEIADVPEDDAAADDDSEIKVMTKKGSPSPKVKMHDAVVGDGQDSH